MERVLRSDHRYAECEIRRTRWEDESKDPFYVLDEKEEEIIMLERWEVYALNGSELLSYIDVQRWRNQVSYRMEFVYMLLLLPVLFAVCFALVGGLFFYFGEHGSFSVSMDLVVLCSVLSLFTVPLDYVLYRHTELRKKNMDLQAVEKDPSFLNALRRVAEAAEADKYRRKEFVKRVKYLEDAMAGIDS
jgi:hypothetical protein